MHFCICFFEEHHPKFILRTQVREQRVSKRLTGEEVVDDYFLPDAALADFDFINAFGVKLFGYEKSFD